jgi:hypothetical protein
MRISRLVALSIFAVLASSIVEAGPLRIALLASTEVQGDTILLAHLLPSNASRTVRDAAGKVALGAAPQAGASRQFTRENLTAAIASSGLSPADFAIPPAVTVRRDSRLITLDEVYAALQFALAKNPMPGLSNLRIHDIALEAEVRVPPGDASLIVTQATFDQSIGRARFRLWPRSVPSVLPFFATAKLTATSPGSPSDHQFVTVASHSPGLIDTSGLVLVSASRVAQLHLHSSNMDILLQVQPLQKGRLGDVIRVRLPATGRTMQARVAGDGYLDATL